MRVLTSRVRSCRAQLDSFDEFIMNTMQEIVDECSTLHLVPQQQHNPLMQNSGARSYQVTFGQIYLSKPTWVEPDQTTCAMFPNEARLRNLTYSAPLYMDLRLETVEVDADGNEEVEPEDLPRIFLGQVHSRLASRQSIQWREPARLTAGRGGGAEGGTAEGGTAAGAVHTHTHTHMQAHALTNTHTHRERERSAHTHR